VEWRHPDVLERLDRPAVVAVRTSEAGGQIEPCLLPFEGIIQTSPEVRLLTANPAMARMFGYDSPEELLENIFNIGEQLYVDAGRRAEFDELVRRPGPVATSRSFRFPAMNASRSAGGSKCLASSRKTKPEISICSPQSRGLGTRPGDQR
jgi:PAS domain-containing protein